MARRADVGQAAGRDVFAEENERRYARGLTPTIAEKRSRNTVADP